MKINDTKMEITTEKESMISTNINFDNIVEFMAQNVLLDKHTYTELLNYKLLVDTEYEQLKLEFDNKLAVKTRMYNDACKQRDDMEANIYKLNNKIAELEKQIKELKKNKKRWLWN